MKSPSRILARTHPPPKAPNGQSKSMACASRAKQNHTNKHLPEIQDCNKKAISKVDFWLLLLIFEIQQTHMQTNASIINYIHSDEFPTGQRLAIKDPTWNPQSPFLHGPLSSIFIKFHPCSYILIHFHPFSISAWLFPTGLRPRPSNPPGSPLDPQPGVR